MPSAAERLSELVRMALSLSAQIDQKEQDLSTTKSALDRIQRTDLPELLKELGLTEATLAEEGVKVKLTDGVDASIPEGVRAEAFEWLTRAGYGALIRAEVKVAFGATELDRAAALAAQLEQQSLAPAVGMSVPPPTLKAWARERLAAGEDIPSELFNVRAYDMARLTAIKPKKVKHK